MFWIITDILAILNILCTIFAVTLLILDKKNEKRREKPGTKPKPYSIPPGRCCDIFLRGRLMYFLFGREDYDKLTRFKEAFSLYAHFELVSAIKPDAYIFSFAGKDCKVYGIFTLPIWPWPGKDRFP